MSESAIPLRPVPLATHSETCPVGSDHVHALTIAVTVIHVMLLVVLGSHDTDILALQYR